jgi:DNA invertase Pin-like site-specific DNA recombinase
VSTKQHGQNPETQLLPLRDHARIRGLVIVEEYVDVGISGAKERRPQLDRLMADARRLKFEAVVVWRFDRFARSTRHLVTACEEFHKLGLQFLSLSENIDTTTPMGQMIFQVMAAFAQLERALIQERVHAGVARARKEGKRLGRPSVLVDRVRIRERVRAGDPIAVIAREAGIARSTVRAIAGKGEA